MSRRVLFVVIVLLAVAGCGVSDSGDREPRAYARSAKVRDSLGIVFTEVGGSLDRLGSTYTASELNSAFRDEPDCRSLS